MNNRYVGQVDYGPDNDKYPRWAVWNQYFIWAGNHGTVRVSEFYWTEAEAQVELARLERLDRPKQIAVLLAFIVATVIFVLLVRWAW